MKRTEEDIQLPKFAVKIRKDVYQFRIGKSKLVGKRFIEKLRSVCALAGHRLNASMIKKIAEYLKIEGDPLEGCFERYLCKAFIEYYKHKQNDLHRKFILAHILRYMRDNGIKYQKSNFEDYGMIIGSRIWHSSREIEKEMIKDNDVSTTSNSNPTLVSSTTTSLPSNRDPKTPINIDNTTPNGGDSMMAIVSDTIPLQSDVQSTPILNQSDSNLNANQDPMDTSDDSAISNMSKKRLSNISDRMVLDSTPPMPNTTPLNNNNINNRESSTPPTNNNKKGKKDKNSSTSNTNPPQPSLQSQYANIPVNNYYLLKKKQSITAAKREASVKYFAEYSSVFKSSAHDVCVLKRKSVNNPESDTRVVKTYSMGIKELYYFYLLHTKGYKVPEKKANKRPGKEPVNPFKKNYTSGSDNYHYMYNIGGQFVGEELMDSVSDFAKEYQFVPMCLNTFKKYLPPHIKRAKNRNDMCNTCEDPNISSGDKDKHKKAAGERRDLYKYQKKNLNNGEVMFTIDFKQNININKSQTEVGKQFYNAVHRSFYGIVMHYKEGNQYKKYVFGKEFMDLFGCTRKEDLFGKDGKIKKFIIWSDNGPTFKNFEWIYKVWQLGKTINCIPIDLEFFSPSHGKSDCDIFFALISQTVKRFQSHPDSNHQDNRTTQNMVDILNKRLTEYGLDTRKKGHYRATVYNFPSITEFQEFIQSCNTFKTLDAFYENIGVALGKDVEENEHTLSTSQSKLQRTLNALQDAYKEVEPSDTYSEYRVYYPSPQKPAFLNKTYSFKTKMENGEYSIFYRPCDNDPTIQDDKPVEEVPEEEESSRQTETNNNNEKENNKVTSNNDASNSTKQPTRNNNNVQQALKKANIKFFIKKIIVNQAPNKETKIGHETPANKGPKPKKQQETSKTTTIEIPRVVRMTNIHDAVVSDYVEENETPKSPQLPKLHSPKQTKKKNKKKNNKPNNNDTDIVLPDIPINNTPIPTKETKNNHQNPTNRATSSRTNIKPPTTYTPSKHNQKKVPGYATANHVSNNIARAAHLSLFLPKPSDIHYFGPHFSRLCVNTMVLCVSYTIQPNHPYD
ncbi:hypothetical protein DFA_06850 [Cavenderia fasciculata]|uniref:Uncharacterized protein n=1 Tax=Cavenderia fasciculata TaxID=261658 RepID=F4PWU7_CACFS|nr:uncharacterized protein DFA_06850 [Cavenderia fasciculata]EGG19750.1 hypothetical protein DFA_06850 [Cavenderia fasciculata]|eukprot:XP_004358096.1 hypothetical protein DFA_06850 [Cavenderia fasciculata]